MGKTAHPRPDPGGRLSAIGQSGGVARAVPRTSQTAGASRNHADRREEMSGLAATMAKTGAEAVAGVCVEDLGDPGSIPRREGPTWGPSHRTAAALFLAGLVLAVAGSLAYVRVAYGVWTPFEAPAVIDGYRLADAQPASLVAVRAWARLHDRDPRSPVILEPIVGRLPLAAHVWDGRHVLVRLPADAWLRVGPDAYLRYQRIDS